MLRRSSSQAVLVSHAVTKRRLSSPTSSLTSSSSVLRHRFCDSVLRSPASIPICTQLSGSRRASLWTATSNINSCFSNPLRSDLMIHPNCNYSPQEVLKSNDNHPFLYQQVRWKRRDGNKKSTITSRPPTKKQLKAHNREKKELHGRLNKHAAPGSRAGPLREWRESNRQELLQFDREKIIQQAQDPEFLKYGMEDALLDDLMGNTKELTSQPSPEPVYLGHQQSVLYDQIQQEMARYRDHLEAVNGSSDRETSVVDVETSPAPSLPSDKSISLVLRAFRDRFGTRQRPVGIVKALQHVLQDIGIPVSAFGEYTYSALLTCCRTPAEGRRIFQLMKQAQHPISAYSWSILVDIHAKVGDYQGCIDVIDEMIADRVPPSMAAYTSLLAACYKVCNDGRVSHAIRAKAAKASWEKWQEMRIVGIEPDVMAYGAMLRLCAAQGHAERALNLLEEMQQFQVKPTTLCFSSALRAVAKSHAIAIRYERGDSRRHKHRETLTLHHGRMARAIVTMAENAEVAQDEGFVAALIMCAAAAGDAATAKAIYVASQIRGLDHLRTIGPDSHLARLRGETSEIPSSGSGLDGEKIGEELRQLIADDQSNESAVAHTTSHDLPALSHQDYAATPSFQEREYGKDSRVFSAILHACAQAVNQNSIGTMWQGRENSGYLCENSLRLLVARHVPQYSDRSIPGLDRTDNLTWDGEEKDEEYRGGKRKHRKFGGVYVDENAAETIDELDDDLASGFVDEDGRLLKEWQKTTPEDIWRMKYGYHGLEDEKEAGNFDDQHEAKVIESSVRKYEPVDDDSPDELYFDDDSMRWKTRPKESFQSQKEYHSEHAEPNHHTRNNEFHLRSAPLADSAEDGSADDAIETEEELYFDNDSMKWNTRSIQTTGSKKLNDFEYAKLSGQATSDSNGTSADDVGEELYFDDDVMRWKTRPKMKNEASNVNDNSGNMDEDEEALDEITRKSTEMDEKEFQIFYSELRQEIADSGEQMEEVDEDEARELFLITRDEYEEVMKMDIDELFEKGLIDINSWKDVEPGSTAMPEINKSQSADRQQAETMRAAQDSGVELNHATKSNAVRQAAVELADAEWASQFVKSQEMSHNEGSHELDSSRTLSTTSNETVEIANVRDDGQEEMIDLELEELRNLLPAFSDKRLRRIRNAFKKSLGDPSLLELVPIVRERMPDYITSTWLKQMASLTARYVVHEASNQGLLDRYILNSALELEASSGSLDRTLEFHATAFRKHKLEPTEYCDRLVLQMLLNNNRFSRALSFKQKVQRSGREMDLPSYGSLVEYCGRRGHVGSAMMLLKECLSIHGAVPGEASLANLRIACRKAGIEDRLTALVGEDPIAWLKRGEAVLKREMSKKGRRNVQLIRNAAVRA